MFLQAEDVEHVGDREHDGNRRQSEEAQHDEREDAADRVDCAVARALQARRPKERLQVAFIRLACSQKCHGDDEHGGRASREHQHEGTLPALASPLVDPRHDRRRRGAGAAIGHPRPMDLIARGGGSEAGDGGKPAAIVPRMTAPHEPGDPPALALSIDRAAAAIGVSENHFRRHVLPEVRSIKVGKVPTVPVIELERWLYLRARFADEE